MDLTEIDVEFGQLSDDLKGALMLAHHRGEVIEIDLGAWVPAISWELWNDTYAYRVKRKPVIGKVVFHGVGPIYHSLHPAQGFGKHPMHELSVIFPTIDGQHVPGVYTSPEGLQIKIEVAE